MACLVNWLTLEIFTYLVFFSFFNTKEQIIEGVYGEFCPL